MSRKNPEALRRVMVGTWNPMNCAIRGTQGNVRTCRMKVSVEEMKNERPTTCLREPAIRHMTEGSGCLWIQPSYVQLDTVL
jgi:hypothetical protein